MGTLLTEPRREDESVRECKMNRMWEIPEVGRTDEGHENILACEDAALEMLCWKREKMGAKKAHSEPYPPQPHAHGNLTATLGSSD